MQVFANSQRFTILGTSAQVLRTLSLTPSPPPPPLLHHNQLFGINSASPLRRHYPPLPPVSLSPVLLYSSTVSLSLCLSGENWYLSPGGKINGTKRLFFLSQVQVITLGAPQLMKILAFSSLLFSCLLRCTVFYSGIENIILSKNHNNEEENKKNNFTYKQIKQELFKIAFYNYKKRNPSTNLQFKNTRKQKSLLKFAGTKKFHH